MLLHPCDLRISQNQLFAPYCKLQNPRLSPSSISAYVILSPYKEGFVHLYFFPRAAKLHGIPKQLRGADLTEILEPVTVSVGSKVQMLLRHVLWRSSGPIENHIQELRRLNLRMLQEAVLQNGLLAPTSFTSPRVPAKFLRLFY